MTSDVKFGFEGGTLWRQESGRTKEQSVDGGESVGRTETIVGRWEEMMLITGGDAKREQRAGLKLANRVEAKY